MIQYFDEHEEPIPSPGGRTQYRSVEVVEGVTVTVQVLDSVPLIAGYEGLPLDAVHAFHARLHPGLPYVLKDAPWTYHFAPDGRMKYKDHTRELGEHAIIVENWSPEGQLMNGTTYLMEDGEIRFAAEFGPERFYFSAFDFSTSHTMPVAELRPQLAALGPIFVSDGKGELRGE